MPQLGETVTEGTITKWLKTVGDAIGRDEPLFEVSTDKVDSEVPSPAAGVLAEIRVQEGETVDVGTVLAVVSDGAGCGADTCRRARTGPSARPDTRSCSRPNRGAAARPRTHARPGSASRPGTGGGTGRSAEAHRYRSRMETAPERRPVLSCHLSCGDCSTRTASTPPRSPAQALGAGSRGPMCSPSSTGVGQAERRQRQRRRGRLHSRTVRRACAARGGRGTPTAGTDEVIPFTNIRRRTAEHMVRSKATSPHTLVVLEADYEAVERVRRSHGPQFRSEEGFSLTYLPFVARATVEALHEWPNLNASVGDDSLIVHHRVNLGIAVDLDHQGLIVPVVPRAEEFTLRGIARRIHELADRARHKKLSADDISGGTFSITNAGPVRDVSHVAHHQSAPGRHLVDRRREATPRCRLTERRGRGHRHPLHGLTLLGVGSPGRRRGIRGRLRGPHRRVARHPRLGGRALTHRAA